MNEVLKNFGINKPYLEPKEELEKQLLLGNKLTVLEAFAKGIKALFLEKSGTDNFCTMIKDDPGAFQLENNPTQEQINNAILSMINADKDFVIALLPQELAQNNPYDFSIFPPENGEDVKDYWIWYVKCSFFPGPYWLVVKRDGSEPEYSYGYM